MKVLNKVSIVVMMVLLLTQTTYGICKRERKITRIEDTVKPTSTQIESILELEKPIETYTEKYKMMFLIDKSHSDNRTHGHKKQRKN